MYYPKQIPYLLDPEFKKYIDYREHRFKELDDYFMCIWEMKSKDIFDKTISNNVLPDACIDIVIDFANQGICFAGFSDETMNLLLNESIDSMGVRMKPGTFYSIFGIPADKAMDFIIPFENIEHDYDLSPILSLTSSEERITYFKNYLLKKIANKPNRDFINIVDNLYQSPQDQKVKDLADNFNCNQKQLFRMFKKHYGISPKVLLNIMRLHLCLTLLLENKMELMDISLQCGFYDQAHFIKEIKRYTGISPLKLLEKYQI